MAVKSTATAETGAQGERAFNIRYKGTLHGDISLIGNNLLACTPGSIGDIHGTLCEDAQSTLLAIHGIDNNYFDMRNVDIDGDAATFNSSSADLALPAGAQVTFAGLYWGAISDVDRASINPARASVKLRTPASAGYINLSATQVDDIYLGGQGNAYQGFVDITQQVMSAGAGTYTVADVLAVQGFNFYAGWAMVVAYTEPSASLRNLVIYDGFAYDPTFQSIHIPLSGFITPSSGPVNATLGIYGSDGDRGNIGDELLLNSVVISDAANPPNNPFNSTISNRGVNVTTRNPVILNNMSVDVDLFDASNIIPNSSTTATLIITATQEKFLPGLVTFSTFVFQPAIQMETRVNDLNGGAVNPGDTLEYTIIMTNTGSEFATDSRLNVALPGGATFVPNSINIISNAGGATGMQTDVPGDDLAEASNGILSARLGTGSSASAGGVISINASATMKYQVKVNSPIFNLTPLANKADLSFRSASTPAIVLTSTSTLNLTASPKVRLLLPITVR